MIARRKRRREEKDGKERVLRYGRFFSRVLGIRSSICTCECFQKGARLGDIVNYSTVFVWDNAVFFCMADGPQSGFSSRKQTFSLYVRNSPLWSKTASIHWVTSLHMSGKPSGRWDGQAMVYLRPPQITGSYTAQNRMAERFKSTKNND